MPELPDITVYIEALKPRILGRRLERARLANPFLLRSVETPIAEIEGRTATDLRRMGKRIVFGFDNELYLVLHLMIAGRLRWKEPETAIPRRLGLAAFDFSSGSLLLTEGGTKRRAALHVVKGEEGLARFDRGGVEVLEAELPRFREALRRESHTLKRALTDPRLLSGIGNAYSDEILHRARLSPLKRTSKLDDDEMERLYNAARDTLSEWTERLMGETGDGFPENVTAFRDGMATHGRFGKPCPVCTAPIQRILYAENECNYCPRCQTQGRILADRSLSRLLKKDWPRTLEELEERFPSRRQDG
jgi:formamidopyrimidine-DNA glycosylase